MDIKKEILPFIKPIGKDENGKFNRKLYNLLKKMSDNQYENRQLKVFFNQKSWWDDSNIEFHKNIHKHLNCFGRQVILSPLGNPTSGHFLSETTNKNKPEHWSLMLYDTNSFIDITDWFFNTYKQIGRCMFDNRHHDFDNQYNNRYYIINKNHRKCRWCGEHFHREHEKVVEVKKYTIWKQSNQKENKSAKV
jgi:hypothetical protein